MPMKNRIILEFYIFLEIIDRRIFILLLPIIGLSIFFLLDIYLYKILITNNIEQTTNNIINMQPLFAKWYERLRRIAFTEIVIIGTLCWSIKQYWKYRKQY